jgi:hypothetical protein
MPFGQTTLSFLPIFLKKLAYQSGVTSILVKHLTWHDYKGQRSLSFQKETQEILSSEKGYLEQRTLIYTVPHNHGRLAALA